MLPGEGATPLKEPVVGGGALSPLALANKAESVVSVTSQCSFSSTIVHVGDKKPPESGTGVAEGRRTRAPSGPSATATSFLAFSCPLAPEERREAHPDSFLTHFPGQYPKTLQGFYNSVAFSPSVGSTLG